MYSDTESEGGGDEQAAVASNNNDVIARSASGISKQELAKIRQWIKETTRPGWYASVPKNLGESSHGKLKADQWRSAMEFDIPVAVAQLWGESTSSHYDRFCCTMHLALAIRYATLHQITELHVAKYTEHMLKHLTLLLAIDPSLRLRPNHHNALHIGDFLRRFGPMHGWWMFPFERVIGKLQRSNTNFKIGERHSFFCFMGMLLNHR